MNVNEFLRRTLVVERFGDIEHIQVRDRVVCKDGFNVSIQASSFHYCSPRENNGPYNSVELGFPSDDMGNEFNEYGEDISLSQKGTVFARVPIEKVEVLLEKHGGIIGTLRYIEEEQ